MSVERVWVETAPAPYEVVIGPGVARGVGQLVKRVTKARKIALVTDSNVADLFGEGIDTELARSGFQSFGFTVPAGEQAKTWQTAGALIDGLAEVGLDRADAVVSLGGGVMGDLAGFAAAVYLRGVDFIQMPTSLLAMVDAAIGGKTGVDLAAGKNLAGAFKQPVLAAMDTDFLAELPDLEWRSGLAEVAKSAVIAGEDFFSWLEANSRALVARDPAVVLEAVKRCVEFKANVVAGDEREEGARECLNYGHTFGHAIEKATGFGSVAHGLAVAEGMRFAVRLAEGLGKTSAEFVARQDALLDALGLGVLECEPSKTELFGAMRSDKKARGGSIRFVLAQQPGVWSCDPVPDDVLVGFVDAWAESKQACDTGSADSSESADISKEA